MNAGARVAARLEELLRAFRGWFPLVSFSYGKDSSALLSLTLRLADHAGLKIGVVYNDAGGDPPALKRYVYDVLEEVRRASHAVYVTRPERTFFDHLLTEYSPLRWIFRWCCKRLKELPFRRLAEELSRIQPVLNLLGTRAEEASGETGF